MGGVVRCIVGYTGGTKKNPNYQFQFEYLVGQPGNASIKAEYLDGTTWEVNPKDMKLNELRKEFYDRAGDCEEVIESQGGLKPTGDAGKKDAKGGKGGKK